VDDPGNAHPAPGDLLDDERVGQQRLAEAAVLLRDHEAEQAHLLHPVDDRLRELVLVLEICRVWEDLLVHEGMDGREDLLLDLGESRGLGEAGHRCSCRPALRRSIRRRQDAALPRGTVNTLTREWPGSPRTPDASTAHGSRRPASSPGGAPGYAEHVMRGGSSHGAVAGPRRAGPAARRAASRTGSAR